MLTVTEAADRLGISARRVRALIAAGRLPAKKYAGVWLILEADLLMVKDRPTGRPRRSQ